MEIVKTIPWVEWLEMLHNGVAISEFSPCNYLDVWKAAGIPFEKDESISPKCAVITKAPANCGFAKGNFACGFFGSTVSVVRQAKGK